MSRFGAGEVKPGGNRALGAVGPGYALACLALFATLYANSYRVLLRGIEIGKGCKRK